MFCTNCGEKVTDEMKFCPNCGKSIKNRSEGIQNNISAHVNLEKNKNMDIKEKRIEDMFWNIFKTRGKFGSRVYFIGKDLFPSQYDDNLKKYLGNCNKDEKVMLVFVYPDSNLEDGFVITNQRLIWHNGTYDMSEILLDDIKDVRIGKSLLATIMNIVSYDDEIYPKIYLTGINSEEEFVLKFRSFIYDIQKMKKTKEKDDDSNLLGTTEENIVDCIINACNSVKIDSLYCVVGNPIVSPSVKKYINAKAYFNIPDHEDVYMIYDETILGGCKKGFALCTTGFYYCKQQSGYIPWNEFKSLRIEKSLGGVIVGSEELDFNTSGDSKQIRMILLGIQELLKKEM